MSAPTYTLLNVIELPGKPLEKFDIGWVDAATRRYYLADRSNARVALIDTQRGTFEGALGEGEFTGATGDSKTSGPNGVVFLGDVQQLGAGDGDSTVKIYDIATGSLVARIDTGGGKRVDELAYDPISGWVLAANDAESVPFLSLISTRPTHEVLQRIDLPHATGGVHQPVWDADSGRFYVPVSEVRGDPSVGEIAVIDPRSKRMTDHWPVRECQPSGLSLGPGHQLLVGCSKAAIDAGFDPKTIVIDIASGSIVRTIMEVGGVDEVWYNPGDRRYYLAATAMTGGPVLGVIDAVSNRWVSSVATSPGSHSVAVDAINNHAFVPLTPSAEYPRGGVGIFGVR